MGFPRLSDPDTPITAKASVYIVHQRPLISYKPSYDTLQLDISQDSVSDKTKDLNKSVLQFRNLRTGIFLIQACAIAYIVNLDVT